MTTVNDTEFVSADDLAQILVDVNAGIPKDQSTIPLNRRGSIFWDRIEAEVAQARAEGRSIECVPSDYPDLTE